MAHQMPKQHQNFQIIFKYIVFENAISQFFISNCHFRPGGDARISGHPVWFCYMLVQFFLDKLFSFQLPQVLEGSVSSLFCKFGFALAVLISDLQNDWFVVGRYSCCCIPGSFSIAFQIYSD